MTGLSFQLMKALAWCLHQTGPTAHYALQAQGPDVRGHEGCCPDELQAGWGALGSQHPMFIR